MTELIKIFNIFILIIFLLKIKWKIGYVFTAASIFLAFLYQMTPFAFFESLYRVGIEKQFWELLIALTLIRIFEKILREKNILARMMHTVKVFLKKKRCVIASMPLLIGMLPSVGGAYFSAPMVEEASKNLGLTKEEKAYTNYWYRHPWEFIFPLYPGLILASAITQLNIRTLIYTNITYAMIMIICGVFFGMKNIGGDFTVQQKKIGKEQFISFSPIILLLGLVLFFNLALHYSLIIVVSLMLIYFRYSLKQIYLLLEYAFQVDIVLLIFGIILFKEVLSRSGAVGDLATFFSKSGIPTFLILFFLPFISGILTGITIGFVGIAFPLLINLADIDKFSLSFAFAAGFSGVLLSPAHVCLILTKEYFKGNMVKIYQKLVPSVIILITAASIIYFLSQSSLFKQN